MQIKIKNYQLFNHRMTVTERSGHPVKWSFLSFFFNFIYKKNSFKNVIDFFIKIYAFCTQNQLFMTMEKQNKRDFGPKLLFKMRVILLKNSIFLQKKFAFFKK